MESRRPVVVLKGFAGQGKTTLLWQLARETGAEVQSAAEFAETRSRPCHPSGVDLVDFAANPADLSLFDLEHPRGASGRKIVIACGPGRGLEDLDRLVCYGVADVIEAPELFLTADEAASYGSGSEIAFLQSAGWPWLFQHLLENNVPGPEVPRFVRKHLIDAMDSETLWLIAALTRLRNGLPDAMLSDDERWRLQQFVPLVAPNGAGNWICAVPAVADIVREQAANAIQFAPPFALAGYAAKLRENGAVADAICAMQAAGKDDTAAGWLRDAGGPWFGHYHGSAAFARVLSGFNENLRKTDTIVLGRVMQSIKQGRMQRARQLLRDHFGPAALSLEDAMDNAEFSKDLRLLLLVMAIYEPATLSEVIIERAFQLVSDLGQDEHLARGLCYNAMLEAYLRQQRLSEARVVAHRALFHFREARCAYLSFFIHLFEAVIDLTEGDTKSAGRCADACETALRKSRIAASNDWRILKLLRGCIHYESGDPAPLVAFIDEEMEQFSFGELWPTLGELCLSSGALALTVTASPAIAQSFLDQWQIEVTRSGQLGIAVVLQQSRLLQDRQHWRAAGRRLAECIDISHSDAGLVEDRHELFAVLLRLRQEAHEHPGEPDTYARLEDLAANPRLTPRQALAVEFWMCHCLARNGNQRIAWQRLSSKLEMSARRGCVAPIIEERAFILACMQKSGQRAGHPPSESVRAILRRLRDPQAVAIVTQADAESGLTRREMRTLRLVAEGCSNKEAARALGISEATVKFHLSNSYRKLSVKNRREAISLIRSRGWSD